MQGEAGASGAGVRRLTARSAGRPPGSRLLLPILFALPTACTEPPDLPRSDAGDLPDAGRPDALPLDAATCDDDRFGRGFPELPAATLAVGVHPALVLCPGVEDWFAMEAAGPGHMRVRVDAAGGVPMRVALLAGDEPPAWVSGLGTASAVAPAGGGALRVGIATDADGPVEYVLRIAAEDAEACEPDALEPDEGPDRASALDGPALRTACAGDEDWFVLEGAAGERVRLDLLHVAGGVLEAELYLLVDAESGGRAGHGLLGAGSGLSLAGRVPEGPARALGRVRLRPGEGFARYRVESVRAGPPAGGVRPGRTSGRLEMLDRAVSEAGLGPARLVAAPGLRLDVVAESDGALLATTRTQEDGTFVTQWLAGDEPLALRAVAEAGGGLAPVRVGPGEAGGLPWALPVLSMRGGSPPAEVVLDTGTEDPLAPALRIASMAERGRARVAAVLPPPASRPPIAYRWRPGRAAACGTCFLPGPEPRIELSGRPADPDEWDDAVILHELGHYVAAVYSRDDSPGGAHDGSRTEPRIAWSEGFATFHAAWQLGSPVQLDHRPGAVRRLDLTDRDHPDARGTADGRLDGPVSERLVAGLLWDLLAAAGPEEAAALAFGPLVGHLVSGADRGAPGVDLVDYLDGRVCAAPDRNPGQVEAAASERDFPYVFNDMACRQKPRGPLAVSRSGDAVVVLAASAGRLGIERGSARSIRAVRAGERVVWRPPAGGAPFVTVSLEVGGQREVEVLAWRPVAPPPLRVRVRAGAVERAR